MKKDITETIEIPEGIELLVEGDMLMLKKGGEENKKILTKQLGTKVSMRKEGSKIILEAMKAEIPVVATRVGGIPEIITQNHNGLLVEPKDSKKLAGVLMKLLNDRKLQTKLAKNGANTLSKFSADRMIDHTEEIYTSLFK